MPVCNNCRNEWSWGDCVKKAFRFRNGIKCRCCGEIQYQTQASMRKASLYGMIPLFLLPLVISFDMSIIVSFAIFFLAELVYLALFPYSLELTNKQEPLW
ncbi:TIGR04104 family putative zinc finger protein [Thalassobacillus sp. CUG 92003]|uniref:TIGR04104 family putative zinc finger protein n=1 Tax=Thalassobacillus sp. CUG 92003 TaxID=2736641 RepID=UPI0015E6D2FB